MPSRRQHRRRRSCRMSLATTPRPLPLTVCRRWRATRARRSLNRSGWARQGRCLRAAGGWVRGHPLHFAPVLLARCHTLCITSVPIAPAIFPSCAIIILALKPSICRRWGHSVGDSTATAQPQHSTFGRGQPITPHLQATAASPSARAATTKTKTNTQNHVPFVWDVRALHACIACAARYCSLIGAVGCSVANFLFGTIQGYRAPASTVARRAMRGSGSPLAGPARSWTRSRGCGAGPAAGARVRAALCHTPTTLPG